MADVDVVDRISDLTPDERPWWLRWVDRYQLGPTGSPTAEAVLSPLEVALADLSGLHVAEEAARDERHRVRVHTGLIPRLKLGTIFQKGVVVSSLPLTEMTFSLGDGVQVMVCSLSELIKETPAGWNRQIPYRILSKCEYPLGGDFLGSKCVVARGRHFTLVLPCHEVFRALYAPHRELALALTMGPWGALAPQLDDEVVPSLGWGRVADPRRTGILPDGNWHITLRKEIDDHFAEVLANLILSETGYRAANAIYGKSLGPFDHSPSFVDAEIPFDRLGRVMVRCLRLPTDTNKFLAFEITAAEWPRPAVKLFIDRENDSREGKDTTITSHTTPFGTCRRVSTDDELVSVTSADDPSRAKGRLSVACDAPRWLNGPEVVKLEKEHSFKYLRQSWVKPAELPTAASAGEALPGRSEFAIADFAGSKNFDVSRRFAEMKDALTELERTGNIECWEPVAPARGRMWHGSLEVWRVPLVRCRQTNRDSHWSYIDCRQGRRRGALVCRIRYRGDTLYWIELEVRESEGGLKALVFRTRDQNPDACIAALLKCAARHRGVWPAVSDLHAEAPVREALTWSHSHVAVENGATAGKSVRLNGARMLAIIDRVASEAIPSAVTARVRT